MKKIMALFIIIGVISGFILGIYMNKNTKGNNQLAKVKEKEETTKREEIEEKILVDNKKTAITPNTKITYKTYYKDCNHIIIESKVADESLINLTEDELKQMQDIGEVQKFTVEEVIIYKEKEGFCDEHYMLKDKEGYIQVYKINKTGNIDKELEKTDISTELLPEEDRKELAEGIKVYTKNELNKIIEDFE